MKRLADAKADGPLEQVFDLQDRIVAQFAETLGTARADAAPRRTHRETSSLEAYQAFTEARVRLESLDASAVAGAIEGLRARGRLDPALRAGARRPRQRPVLAVRDVAGAQPARRGRCWPAPSITCAAPSSSSAIWRKRTPASRSCSSARGRFAEALAAARRAVALEPGYWGNHFRLAHADWGEDRLRALARAIELYPDFPFAHFEAAMVHIARGALDRAESVLREGTIVQDRQANLRQRYPAKGLHWLLGLVRLAQGRRRGSAGGIRSRDRGRPVAALRRGVRDERATTAPVSSRSSTTTHAAAVPLFRRALELYPEHARSLVGLGRRARRARRPAGRRCRVQTRHGRDRRAAPRRPEQRSHARRSLPSRRLRPPRRGRRAC